MQIVLINADVISHVMPFYQFVWAKFFAYAFDNKTKIAGICDSTGRIEIDVRDFAIKDNLWFVDVGTIDVAEDSDIFGATTQRKSNGERIAVRTCERAIFSHELKGSTFL